MINIISRSILNRKVRGPKKVALNLIKGLGSIDYPYVINRSLDSTNRLWIQDDISALNQINSLPERVKVILGPNLFVNPEEIPKNLNLEKVLYIQPSKTVENIWRKKGFNESMAVWPSGIDVDEFSPSNFLKEQVLIYFKNRNEDELKEVEKVLKEKKISFKLIRYGNYNENEYKETLKTTKYIIWLGVAESQGLALEEALSMNIPILVIDNNKTFLDEPITSAPYFSSLCGIKINDLRDLPNSLVKMENEWQNFAPRDYILQNLSLERQAHQFINFFEDHFHITVDEGKREKLQNNNTWRNNTLWFKIYWRIREMIKYKIK